MKLYICLLLALTLHLVLAQNSTSQEQPEEDQVENSEEDGEHLRGPQCPDLMTDITNHCINKNHEECFVCLFKGCGPEDGIAIPPTCDSMKACIAKNFARC
jgi:hypothetical protein